MREDHAERLIAAIEKLEKAVLKLVKAQRLPAPPDPWRPPETWWTLPPSAPLQTHDTPVSPHRIEAP